MGMGRSQQGAVPVIGENDKGEKGLTWQDTESCRVLHGRRGWHLCGATELGSGVCSELAISHEQYSGQGAPGGLYVLGCTDFVPTGIYGSVSLSFSGYRYLPPSRPGPGSSKPVLNPSHPLSFPPLPYYNLHHVPVYLQL